MKISRAQRKTLDILRYASIPSGGERGFRSTRATLAALSRRGLAGLERVFISPEGQPSSVVLRWRITDLGRSALAEGGR